MRKLIAARITFAVAAVWIAGMAYLAAQNNVTVWSGVYSDAQAYRGEKVADTRCIGCHGSNFDGGDSGPKLTGGPFLENWSTQSVGQLFDWLLEAMPADAPGTLSKPDATAVIAYILKLNKMPAGKQDLPAEPEELNRIEIVVDKP